MGWKQTGRQMRRGVHFISANQITLLCVNKTLNPFGIYKRLNTITLAVVQTNTRSHDAPRAVQPGSKCSDFINETPHK